MTLRTRRPSMSFPALLLLVVIVITSASTLAGNLPDAWRHWRYSRTFQSPDYAGPSEFPLPSDLFFHSENHLADLRIINDQGVEVPFVLVARQGQSETRVLQSRIRESSFAPGQFTQIVLDVDNPALFHEAVRIETSESEFISWVEVAASDDARVWRIVQPRAPISHFRDQGLQGIQTVPYSENSARFLRLRIFEAAKAFSVSAAEVLTILRTDPERAAIPVSLTASSSDSSLSRWRGDLGTQIPVTEVSFDVAQPEFFRAVRIFASDNGEEWKPAGSGEIYRYRVGEKLRESLVVQFAEVWGPRYWKVEVTNGNDVPLLGAHPTLLMTPRRIYSRFEPLHRFRLIYGNFTAQAPQYDLSRTLDNPKKIASRILALGPEEMTANYLDPRPFSERHPALLWVALLFAVLLLGYSALRALRPTSPAGSA